MQYGTRDPFEIAECLGIYLKVADIGRQQGFFRYIDGVPCIFISSRLNMFQRILVCAHELGHYFLHSDIAKESVLREFGMFNMKDVIENEANVFASELLLDEDELLEHFEEGYTVFQAASMLGYNINLLYIKLREMNNRGYDFDLSWGNSELF
jgi:Zn-dependent peptidase ImmA (M78 family)